MGLAESFVARARRWFAAAVPLVGALALAIWWVPSGPSGEHLGMEPAPNLGMGAAPPLASGSMDVAPVSALPAPAPAAPPGKREEPAASPAAALPNATILLRVLECGTGRPAPSVEIQTLPSRTETLMTDSEGRVEILADPGEHSPGAYILRADSTRGRQRPDVNWIGADWSGSRAVTVGAEVKQVTEWTVKTPACGEVAWLSGTVLTDGDGRLSVKVSYVDAEGEAESKSLFFQRAGGPRSLGEPDDAGYGVKPFRLGIDLDQLPSRVGEMSRQVDGEEAVVQIISLVPGGQSVVVPVR